MKQFAFTLMLFVVVLSPLAAVCQRAGRTDTSGIAAGTNDTDTILLPRDTRVELRLTETVSSADRHKEDVIHLEVVSDIEVGGMVVVPAGTEAVAKLTTVRPRDPKAKGYDVARDGYLEFSDADLILSGGRRIRLSDETARGRRNARILNATAVVLAPLSLAVVAAGYAIALPIAAATALDHPAQRAPAHAQTVVYQGKDMVFEYGKEFTRYTRDRVQVDVVRP